MAPLASGYLRCPVRWECLKLPLSSLPRASGYLLSQILPRPKLAVIAHFPVADDTAACALQSVQSHLSDASYPVFGRDIVWATDQLVLSVKAGQITQRMGQVGDYTFGVPRNVPADRMTPKYHTANWLMDPTAQLDLTTLFPAYNEVTKTWNYCENGY